MLLTSSLEDKRSFLYCTVLWYCDVLDARRISVLHITGSQSTGPDERGLGLRGWSVWQMLPWRLPPLFQFRAQVLSWATFLKKVSFLDLLAKIMCSICAVRDVRRISDLPSTLSTVHGGWERDQFGKCCRGGCRRCHVKVFFTLSTSRKRLYYVPKTCFKRF